MFDLVNDVAAYPEFLHWCRDSAVERVSDTEVIATLEVGLGGMSKTFTTRNTLERPERIAMELVDGPFRSLTGAWSFRGVETSGCVVGLELDFQVAHMPLESLFAALFEEMVGTQVAAFVARANTLYG